VLTPKITNQCWISAIAGRGRFSGGDGFLLQKLSGEGTAWLELSGELVARDLDPGENLRVHPGHVGAFSVQRIVSDYDRGLALKI